MSNKNDLKKILKPLIKECIKEVIFEEGVLSTVITEVMKGTSGSQRIVETERPRQTKQNFVDREKKLKEAKERKRKLLDSIGKDAYNICQIAFAYIYPEQNFKPRTDQEEVEEAA